MAETLLETLAEPPPENRGETITVNIVSGEFDAETLTLLAGSTVQDCIDLSNLVKSHTVNTVENFPEYVLSLGIWGKRVQDFEKQILSPNDRIELYTPLLVNPMDARRTRSQQNPIKRQTKRDN